ncbi:MAG TPA: aldose 1-epimerase [Solirubrobacteraceae bacterium]|nr:aldose 1-epimerase [Solirubrobacteraceae bacterium]
MAAMSLLHRGEELLGRRDGIAAYALTGATTGIPFLHPWANRLTTPDLPEDVPRDERGLAIHGVLPRAWRVLRAGTTGVHAVLDFPWHAAFPYEHRVDQRIALDPRRLRIETALTATGDVPVPVSFGFHPYLRLPGEAREDWVVALPRRRRLLTDRRGIPTGEGVHEVAEVKRLRDRTFDHGYDRLGPRPRFAVGGGGRRITVELVAGYNVAQVYAPGDDDVICFEPMTAPTNALVSGNGLRTVPPGATFRAAFTVAVDG